MDPDALGSEYTAQLFVLNTLPTIGELAIPPSIVEGVDVVFAGSLLDVPADRSLLDATIFVLRTGSGLNGDVDGSGAVNVIDRSRINTQMAAGRHLAEALRSLLDD